MKLRLSLKHQTKNAGAARPITVRVRPRALDTSLGKVEKKLNVQLSTRPIPAAPSQALTKPDGRISNGKHMKSNPPSSEQMQKVRAMRKFYGKHMPVPACNTCAFSTNCPQYKADYECAFIPFLNAHKVETVEDIMLAMENSLEANVQRLHLATIFERLSGGAPSAELSESYAMMFQQLSQLHEIKKNGGLAAPSSGRSSTITQLFGDINLLVQATASHHKEIIDAPIDLDSETNNDQLALTPGVEKSPVAAELLAELDSKDSESSPRPAKAMSTISQGTIKST